MGSAVSSLLGHVSASFFYGGDVCGVSCDASCALLRYFLLLLDPRGECRIYRDLELLSPT